jgi:hypothetical protein
VLAVAGVLAAVAPAAYGEPLASPTSTESARLTGSFSTYVDGRRGHRSASTRQDWDITSDLEAHLAPPSRSWSADLHVRGTADVDGRRPSEEPGIYNGIQETFSGDVQPFLYRASIERNLEQDLGIAELTGFRLGRQYRTEGDFLWFDGLELSGRLPVSTGANITGAVFGGVPVRLFESATDAWLGGGALTLGLGQARVGLEAYHVENRDRLGFLRKDNVGRVSLAAPIGTAARVDAVARAIDDDEYDGRARLTVNLPRGIQLRGDYRIQGEDRGPHASELDAASLVMGRAIGASRRAFQEYGADVMVPLGDHLSVDVGGASRQTEGPLDVNNINFERYFAAISLSNLEIGTHAVDISVTGEAYETVLDWTRALSGDIAVKLTPNLKASVGSSYALYQYDYIAQTVRQNVRTGTARLVWNAKKNLRLEGRYDLEDDDFRLHHYVRAGFRYDF